MGQLGTKPTSEPALGDCGVTKCEPTEGSGGPTTDGRVRCARGTALGALGAAPRPPHSAPEARGGICCRCARPEIPWGASPHAAWRVPASPPGPALTARLTSEFSLALTPHLVSRPLVRYPGDAFIVLQSVFI